MVACGLHNAQSVIAIADKGSLLHAPDIYMEKLACGPELAGKLRLEDPLEVTLQKAVHYSGKSLSELTVMVLDRKRHEQLIAGLRKAGSDPAAEPRRCRRSHCSGAAGQRS